MQNIYILIALAILAGIAIPVQGALNTRLAGVLDSPILSAFFSFLVGTAALFVYVLLSGSPLGNLSSIKNAPASALTGGLFGAFFVASTIMLIPRLGVAVTFGIVVAGQMIFSVVIDNFGLLGSPVRSVSLARIGGILLITAGAIIIRRY
jgi:transporter family-2 protein